MCLVLCWCRGVSLTVWFTCCCCSVGVSRCFILPPDTVRHRSTICSAAPLCQPPSLSLLCLSEQGEPAAETHQTLHARWIPPRLTGAQGIARCNIGRKEGKFIRQGSPRRNRTSRSGFVAQAAQPPRFSFLLSAHACSFIHSDKLRKSNVMLTLLYFSLLPPPGPRTPIIFVP